MAASSDTLLLRREAVQCIIPRLKTRYNGMDLTYKPTNMVHFNRTYVVTESAINGAYSMMWIGKPTKLSDLVCYSQMYVVIDFNCTAPVDEWGGHHK